MTSQSTIKIGELLEISESPSPQAVFRILRNSARQQRLSIAEISAAQFQFTFSETSNENWLWAIPKHLCGDSPTQYHPKFLMALLFSLPSKTQNSPTDNFLDWQFPNITFETDEWTRRSMTLNGMRMSTEYFASNSPRVLQLIEQRLQAGQADVVHDVMVYLMQRVLELHASIDEERALQAESLAAYLGLDARRVQQLLFDWPLPTIAIAQKIESGFAGPPRQTANIAALIQNQLARFSAAIEELKIQEDKVFRLLDEVMLRLYRLPEIRGGRLLNSTRHEH